MAKPFVSGLLHVDQLMDLFGRDEGDAPSASRVVFRALVCEGSDGQWFPYASRIWAVTDSKTSAQEPIRFDGAVLCETIVDSSQITSYIELTALANSWLSTVNGLGRERLYAPSIQLNRVGGYASFLSLPAIVGHWREIGDVQNAFPRNTGPFFQAERSLVFRNLADMAADWTRVPGHASLSQPANGIDVAVVDARARFLAGKVDDLNVVTVEIESASAEDLTCGLFGSDNLGQRIALSAPIVRGAASFQLDMPARELELFIFDRSGSWYDRVQENQHQHPLQFAMIRSDAADIGAEGVPFTEDEIKRLQPMLDRIDELLVSASAEGPFEQHVRQELASLRRDIRSVQKGQWKKLLVGTVMKLAIQSMVPPEVAQQAIEIGQSLWTGLQNLLPTPQ